MSVDVWLILPCFVLGKCSDECFAKESVVSKVTFKHVLFFARRITNNASFYMFISYFERAHYTNPLLYILIVLSIIIIIFKNIATNSELNSFLQQIIYKYTNTGAINIFVPFGVFRL